MDRYRLAPQLERTLGAEIAGDRNPKKRRGGVNGGAVHSQARELVVQGYAATLVAPSLLISRSSLYYRKKPRGSRADRRYDEQIVLARGEKVAYGYRRIAWWLRARRRKEWGRVEAGRPNKIWQEDMTKVWAGPSLGWAYLVSVIDRRAKS
jgi:hypothetical protein